MNSASRAGMCIIPILEICPAFASPSGAEYGHPIGPVYVPNRLVAARFAVHDLFSERLFAARNGRAHQYAGAADNSRLKRHLEKRVWLLFRF